MARRPKQRAPVAHDFVNYEPWLKADSMSSVTRRMLTPLGLEVFEKAREFFGASPTFSGASRRGMYLKFAVSDDQTIDNVAVFRDWLLDKGIEAELTVQEGSLKGARQRYVRVELRSRKA